VIGDNFATNEIDLDDLDTFAKVPAASHKTSSPSRRP